MTSDKDLYDIFAQDDDDMMGDDSDGEVEGGDDMEGDDDMGGDDDSDDMGGEGEEESN